MRRTGGHQKWGTASLFFFLSQVEDLAVASPATVSRCGMVYMEPQALGLTPLIMSWINTLPSSFTQEHRDMISKLCKAFIEPAITFVRRNCKETIRTVNNNLCASCLRLLECLLGPFWASEDRMPSKELLEKLPRQLTPIFVFALAWSVGITTDSKEKANPSQQRGSFRCRTL